MNTIQWGNIQGETFVIKGEMQGMGAFEDTYYKFDNKDWNSSTNGRMPEKIYKLKAEKAAPTPEAPTVGGRKRRNKTNKRINKKKRNTKKRR